MMKVRLFIILLFFGAQLFSQQQQDKNIDNQVMKYLAEAENHFEKGEMALAEVAYRKAISISPDNDLARYNFGNLYIDYKRDNEALQNLNEASKTSKNKSLKHKSLHNQGNILMKKEKYAQAAKVYKEALKNDPSDDETRYNFALAKKLMKNQKQKQDKQDKNKKDKKKNKKKQKNKNKEGGDKKENQDSQDKKDKGKNSKDKSDKGKDNKPKKEDKQDQNAQKDKKEQSEKQEKQKVRKAKLSPQQIKNILKAIENQEKKVQKKLNKKKQEGKPVKTEKDW